MTLLNPTLILEEPPALQVDVAIVERAAAEVNGEPVAAVHAGWGAPGSLRRTAWLAGAGLVLTLGAAWLASQLMRQP
jgi:hypothetical protein